MKKEVQCSNSGFLHCNDTNSTLQPPPSVETIDNDSTEKPIVEQMHRNYQRPLISIFVVKSQANAFDLASE